MVTRIDKAGALGGFLFLGFFFIGFWPLAHFLPPQTPMDDAASISAMYQGNTDGIRLAMVCLCFGAMFYIPYIVTMANFIRRMEGGAGFLTLCELAGGITGSLFLFIPAMIWELAAFRPDRSIELTQFTNDAGWLFLIAAVPPFILQTMPLGVAILIDKSQPHLFPRWFAWLTFGLELTYLPGMAAYFYKSGPFAWSGLFPYWVPFTTYGFWIAATSWIMFRSVNVIIRETA
ncbi:hypothetical protein GCM10010909_18340 [Acidocella aquatica]|uniref:DUF4386 domain-containing protein n=1 Tax=Acidocella aquatica TaxID=1922313 RepID=A0ABQ6A767_9PROT|nr:hypothetical protein [Acidocella aquatica]GLR67153.1 hypothetical protein GCM10010909_18340 [Acidocella aquatica]